MQKYAQVMGVAFQKCISGGGESALREGVEQVLSIMDQAAAEREASNSTSSSTRSNKTTSERYTKLKVDRGKLASLISLDFPERHAR